MRSIFTLITVSALVLCQFILNIESIAQEEDTEQLLFLDFEDSDGGFSHDGINDPWERGMPGAGKVENPGPLSSFEGQNCFGSPLNGTYENGTRAYLITQELEVASYLDLVFSYMIWFDLEIMEDELNGTGEILGNDHLLVQLSEDGGPWMTLYNHTGSSGGDWVRNQIDLSFVASDTIRIRYYLVDVLDGRTDNGAFIDTVELNGKLRPMVDITLAEPPSIAPIIPTGERLRVHFVISNRGRTVPPNTDVTMEINGPEGFVPFTDEIELSNERIQTHFFEWDPWNEGLYELFVNLTVDGNREESLRLTSTAINPLFYDDFTFGLDSWSTISESGEYDWEAVEANGPTLSSGNIAYFGEVGDNGEQIGFKGGAFASMISSPLDLKNMDDAHLYIIHSYGFLGEQGSCGGVVQGHKPDGDWITLEPDLPHVRQLEPGSSGPLEGIPAFQGDRSWYQIGFDLGQIVGSITSIRFSVSSGEEGEGRGWLIDDVLITGEGFDPYDNDPPEPIMGLEISIVDDGWIEVAWTPSFAADLHHYNIYLGEGETGTLDSSNLYMTVQKGNDTAISISNLEENQTYWIAVTAVDRNENEEKNVARKVFRPVSGGINQPPVAEARIVGPRSGKLGDEFRFNASSSFDPDNDPILFEWILPDGSTSEGREVMWKSTISGEDLEIRLTVEDVYGASDSQNLTVSVKEEGSGDVRSDDIYNFLICMIPLSIILIVIILIFSAARGSRQRRLKRRLKELDLERKGDVKPEEVEVVVQRTSDSKDGSNKRVADLVPVLTAKTRKKDVENGSPETAFIEPEVEHRREIVSKGRDSGDPEVKRKISVSSRVTAIVECPYCGKTFKESFHKSKVESGKSLDIQCPHCGRSGST